MPRVNIYIRNEDQAKWDAIDNKPEWLHEHLNSNSFMPTYKQEGKTVKLKIPTLAPLCEHFQPKGQCLVKGCKYRKGKK